MSAYGDNEKLLREYQKTKDIELRNRIALKNYNLIYIGIRPYYIAEIHDKEELEQEGFIALLKAVENFNIEKGYSFSTYAISYIKSITRYRLDYNTNTSLDESLKSIEDENITRLDLLEDEKADVFKECENKDIISNIKTLLKDEEIELIKLAYIYDLSYREIEKRIGVSKTQIGRNLQNIKIKLRGCRQFKEYKYQYYQENEISYLKATNYSWEKTTNSNNKYPQIWATLFAREKREKKCMKNFMKDFKKEIRAEYKNKPWIISKN